VVGVLGAVVLALLAAAIVSITGPRSTREALACTADDGVLGNYQATRPPTTVSDAAFTAPVGEVSQEALDLIQTTREALWCGIEQARVGNHLGDVSFAIGNHAGSYGIIDEYGGHGVGRAMHEEPHILNKGRAGVGMPLRKGMVVALEPMFATGHPATEELDDQWTVVMRDGGLAAHWEETIAITDDGPEVLTRI